MHMARLRTAKAKVRDMEEVRKLKADASRLNAESRKLDVDDYQFRNNCNFESNANACTYLLNRVGHIH